MYYCLIFCLLIIRSDALNAIRMSNKSDKNAQCFSLTSYYLQQLGILLANIKLN